MKESPAYDSWAFKRAALIYPQPVASASGRILRTSTPQEQIDACLKAAEILCRYLAALALSSLRSRDIEDFPDNVKPLSGALSFGHYLSVVQAIAKAGQHPLYPYFKPFRPRGKGRSKAPGKADATLGTLLTLRNEIGHDLVTLSKPRAETLLKKHAPCNLLLDAYQALDSVLSLPLFVLCNLGFEKKQIVAQQLLLMGESNDPIPKRICMSQALDEFVPYIAVGDKALMLPPVLIFDLIDEQSAYRLAFLDAVREGKLRFKTLESRILDKDGDSHSQLEEIFAGRIRELEEAGLPGGITMTQQWADERKIREDAGRKTEGLVPWESYASETLEWYSNRLPNDDSGSPQERIVGQLLDDRTSGFSEEELRQLLLLFGKDGNVRKALGREMYDFRAVSEPGSRWDERISESKNVLYALNTAIEFFAKHVGVDAGETADLTCTKGSADYIAMREALVNQFIHQDYSDSSAAAQVELSGDTASFFNTGHSLVTQEYLTDGGKSQARNPLIARALRIVGFAELAGSGICALQFAWRDAHRRPPVIESDREGNTFSLTLDWREVPNAYDEVWKKKLGVQLTEQQAEVLNLVTDPAGITEYQAAAGTSMKLTDTRETLRYLVNQVLVEEHDGRFHLKAHHKELL